MAFATKYKTEIQNWDGDTISAEIQFDGSTATVESFTAIGSNPITIEHQANTNVKESYIIPSKATVSFYVNDEWDCHDLLYVNDREAKMIISVGTVKVFTGWVIAAVNTEAYTTGQYQIRVEAIDGLLDLKDIQYLNSGALYDTFRYPSTIIGDCLAQTGHSLAWWENIDIYATGMTTTATTHSPLNQSYIHTKAYGETPEDALTCYEVLEHILQAFHCRLYQTSELDGGDNSVWVLAKIDKIDTTATFREWNAAGTTITGNTSYAQLKTLSTAPIEPHHVNGAAQIAIQQAFNDINLTAERGKEFGLLAGQNFEDDDFPTASSLTNWGTLDKTQLIATWSTSTITKTTRDGNTVCELGDFTPDHTFSSLIPANNGSGKVRLDNSVGLTTSDWIVIPDGYYKGIWKVTAINGTTWFDIDATFNSNETDDIAGHTINNLEGIEYDGSNDIFSIVPLDGVDTDLLNIDVEYYRNNIGPVVGDDATMFVVLLAWKSTTDYKIVDSDGAWVDYDANSIQPIIVYEGPNATNDKKTISVSASMSAANNFYTSGSPLFYLGIFTNEDDGIEIDSVRITMTGGDTKTASVEANADMISSYAVDFFHADGDDTDNEEHKYIRPIYNTLIANRRFYNAWSQAGAAADNLEDIIQANLATAYGENSQIWSGTIKGDINISHSIKDPLNLDRIFQIQRISKNLENNFNSLSMIEIEPSEVYYVELMSSDTGVDAYYLSSEYDDISADFASGTIFISNMRRKSDGALVESGNEVRTLDGAATFTGGRVKIIVSDMAYTIDPLTGLEVKGVLRKV